MTQERLAHFRRALQMTITSHQPHWKCFQGKSAAEQASAPYKYVQVELSKQGEVKVDGAPSVAETKGDAVSAQLAEALSQLSLDGVRNGTTAATNADSNKGSGGSVPNSTSERKDGEGKEKSN